MVLKPDSITGGGGGGGGGGIVYHVCNVNLQFTTVDIIIMTVTIQYLSLCTYRFKQLCQLTQPGAAAYSNYGCRHRFKLEVEGGSENVAK